ncbi:MAG: nucleotidyltransferase domain-containing protein [Nanoarchaeota archaeon]|nr:nucleotidyltransferase domain-containing protein [Nanoarchaeota archaeon]
MIDIITLSTTEAEALHLFAGDMEKKMSILQIAKKSGKHYPNVFQAVKSLARKGIIRTETFGKATACSLNKESPLLPLFMAFVEEQKASLFFRKFPFLKTITAQAKAIAPECTAGIFGSHAEGTAAAKSDIDLFIIADSKNMAKFRQFMARYFPEHDEVHLAALSFEEFTLSVASKEYTVGREIAKNGVALTGAELFFQARISGT